MLGGLIVEKEHRWTSVALRTVADCAKVRAWRCRSAAVTGSSKTDSSAASSSADGLLRWLRKGPGSPLVQEAPQAVTVTKDQPVDDLNYSMIDLGFDTVDQSIRRTLHHRPT